MRNLIPLLFWWWISGLVVPARVEGQSPPTRGDAADRPNSGEITAASDQTLNRGLAWLARNQTVRGNWDSDDLGLVSMGALAFLSAGHLPGRGPYGETVERAISYVVDHVKPSGLLNAADSQRDMYNHGLATFVLGQTFGMTEDPRVGQALDKALKLIAQTQCEDGGWDYRARRQRRGHDLSLVVMQAKALRSAVDSGFEVRNDVIRLAIQSVREHYKAENNARGFDERARFGPGQFTYDGNRSTLAMAACGVVCLQEFGQYDDWRIPKNLEVIDREIGRLRIQTGNGEIPFDAYTLYYVGQALYQVGGTPWEKNYPLLREAIIKTQLRRPDNSGEDGSWRDTRWVHGRPGMLYGTSVGCFLLSIPNRYLPILQEGRIEGLDTFGKEPSR